MKVKNIIIVCAMEGELRHIDIERFRKSLSKYNIEIGYVLTTGVGKIRATMNLTEYLALNKIFNLICQKSSTS